MNGIDKKTDGWRSNDSFVDIQSERKPSKDLDLEKQSRNGLLDPKLIKKPSYLEYEVPTRVKLIAIAQWFLLNLALTLYNKAVLGNFAFPWLLTAIHTGASSIGCCFLLQQRKFKLTTLNAKDQMILAAFSFLFTINIAISNVSLAYVSVPLHQVVRSTAPFFVVLVQWMFYSRSYDVETLLSLLPVVIGAVLTTKGDYSCAMFGLALTVGGVIISVVRTIIGNNLMTGRLALPTLEVLFRLSPLAAIQCIMYAIITGEGRDFMEFVARGSLTNSLRLALLGNGLIAFLLNVSSFHTNKIAGALTLSIAGNIKQCLTILLGILLFKVQVGLVGGIGMLVSVIGAAWYSKVELHSQGRSGQN